MRKTAKSNSGQTLLELIIALGVVALVTVALISAVISSLRFGEGSRLRSRGVKIAQEGIELTRKLRDVNTWNIFVDYSGSGTAYWCVDAVGLWTLSDAVDACPIEAGSSIWRRVAFTWNDPVMEVVSTASWGERSAGSTVQMKTFFTEWK